MLNHKEPQHTFNKSNNNLTDTIIDVAFALFCCSEQQMPDVCFVLANAKAIATAATEAGDDSTAVGDSYS